MHVVVVPPEHVAVAAITHVEFEAHQAHPNAEAAAQYVHPSVVYVPHVSAGGRIKMQTSRVHWHT